MNIHLTVWMALILLGKVVFGAGEPGDAIVGQWLTSEKGARIEIYRAEGNYYGKIVWTKDPTYSANDPEAGQPVRDRNNPDVAKRDQPILGLVLLRDFEYTGDHSWRYGTIYNPKNGKSYKARLFLNQEGSLDVRGYVGVSFLGKTTVWTRYKQIEEAKEQK